MTSKEILPEDKRILVSLCKKLSTGNDSLANLYRNLLLYHQSLTAAESDNERKDKEIEEFKTQNSAYLDTVVELNRLCSAYKKEIEDYKLMFDNYIKNNVEKQTKEIEELKRENEEWKQHDKKQCERIYNLLSTIDRMKQDHASYLENLRSESVVIKQIGK